MRVWFPDGGGLPRHHGVDGQRVGVAVGVTPLSSHLAVRRGSVCSWRCLYYCSLPVKGLDGKTLRVSVEYLRGGVMPNKQHLKPSKPKGSARIPTGPSPAQRKRP